MGDVVIGGGGSTGFFFPAAKYGVKGDGSNSTAALKAAIADAMPVSGTVVLPTGAIGIDSEIQLLGVDRAVTLIGSGQDHNGSVIKALTSAARLSWGETPTSSGTSSLTLYGRPGVSGNFSFEGNLIATQGILIGPACAYGTFQNIQVWKCNGNGWLQYGQNDTYINCNSAGHAGHGWVHDYGTQECQFYNCNASANDGWQQYFRQSGGAGWGASAQPQALGFFGGIAEQPGSPYFANTGLGGVYVREGLDISFNRFDMSSNAGQFDLEAVPAVTASCYTGRITLRDCRTQRAIYANAATQTQTATLSGPLSTAGAITALPVNATTVAIPVGQKVRVTSGTNYQEFTYSGGASLATGATSIPVNSQTPNFNYPTNSVVSNSNAQSMGGTNEPFLLEGWNYLVTGIINGSTGAIYDSGKGPIASYVAEGSGATPAAVTTNKNISTTAGVAATGNSPGDAQGVPAGTYIGKSGSSNGGIDFADGTNTYGIDTNGAAAALRFTKAATAILGQFDSVGNLGTAQGIRPGASTTATTAQLLMGSGAPTSSAPSGTLYIRTDTPGTANQRLYINTSAGSGTTWTAIL